MEAAEAFNGRGRRSCSARLTRFQQGSRPLLPPESLLSLCHPWSRSGLAVRSSRIRVRTELGLLHLWSAPPLLRAHHLPAASPTEQRLWQGQEDSLMSRLTTSLLGGPLLFHVSHWIFWILNLQYTLRFCVSKQKFHKGPLLWDHFSSSFNTFFLGILANFLGDGFNFNSPFWASDWHAQLLTGVHLSVQHGLQSQHLKTQ